MKVRYWLLTLVFLIIITNLAGASESDYNFELKTFTRELPNEIHVLFTTSPNISKMELGGLALASSLILWDESLYNTFHKSNLADFSYWDTISLFGEPALYGLTGLAFAHNNQPLGEDLMYSVGLTGASTVLLKFVTGMARPYVGEGIQFIGPNFQTDYAAFPSGHTATAFTAATVFSYYYPDYSPLFWVGASLVGLSRISQEKHWPSNLLFGAILGYISARHALEVRNPVQQ